MYSISRAKPLRTSQTIRNPQKDNHLQLTIFVRHQNFPSGLGKHL